MRKLLITLLLIPVFAVTKAQQANDIKGYWLVTEKDTKIKIFEATNGLYYGKIVWLEEPNETDGTPKRDDKNPNTALRSRMLNGLLLLKEFTFDNKDKKWINGSIYDARSGKTYSCVMRFEQGNTNRLFVKGYIGISLIGKQVEWTRSTAP